MQKILNILKNSDFGINSQDYTLEEINRLENALIQRQNKEGEAVYYVECLIRGKEILVKPEEIVRQLFLHKLINVYRYKGRIQVEYIVYFGTEKKRADIVVFDRDRPTVPYIVVELKKPNSSAGKEQLRSYCNATGAPIGVWTNGNEIKRYRRQDPNIFEEIRDIPTATQTLKEVLAERFTILDLILNDKLKKQSLQQVIKEFEDEVLANAGVDVFEEAFKLIFTKLYDENLSSRDKQKISNWLELNPDKEIKDLPENIYKQFRNLEFKNLGVEMDTKRQIDALFEKAKEKWHGIFSESARIELSPSHLQTCVSYLQDVKLFNSNLEVVDDAFEYLVNKDIKGEKGQYFTPRYIVDMCVKMLNPKPDEYMIDTAAGSCGFPVHTIFHIWQQLNPGGAVNFGSDEKTAEQEEYVRTKVFAIDFDLKSVRVGRTLNLIAGDGETNVLHLNSLDYERWETDNQHNEYWKDNFTAAFGRLKKRAREKGSFRYFDFSVLMANPPFAGDIKDSRVITKYDIAQKPNGKGFPSNISRDILFIQRNLDMLRDGGRMAVVLPQGRFNNASDGEIRKYIASNCRILAVIGLHVNSFKPHTGTKTSVLFVQKWHPQECPKTDDYNIFFATQMLEGKNSSGDKLYWDRHSFLSAAPRGDFSSARTTTKPELALRDRDGHPIVYHDLFSSITELKDDQGRPIATPDGIFEAFREFARKERLGFF